MSNAPTAPTPSLLESTHSTRVADAIRLFEASAAGVAAGIETLQARIADLESALAVELANAEDSWTNGHPSQALLERIARMRALLDGDRR